MRLRTTPLFFALVTALLIPISASAQTDTFCTAVYDANGNRIGQATQSGGETTLLLNQNGRIVRLSVGPYVIDGGAVVYYTGEGCTGDAYMTVTAVQPIAQKQSALNDVWYPDTVAGTEYLGMASQIGTSAECIPSSRSDDMFPALHMTLPAYSWPFHLEPEACYTPDPAVAALTPYSLGAMAFVLAFGTYLMVRRPRVA
jgi:hypothetical protein